jgi:hypothetical protein
MHSSIVTGTTLDAVCTVDRGHTDETGSVDDLAFHPCNATVLGTAERQPSDDNAAAAFTVYIIKCLTPSGREWGVARRYSEFEELRREVLQGYRDSNPAAKLALQQLPFPKKESFVFTTAARASRVSARVAALEQYLNSLMGMFPGEKTLSMFLAFDGSVDTDTAAAFGLESTFYGTPAGPVGITGHAGMRKASVAQVTCLPPALRDSGAIFTPCCRSVAANACAAALSPQSAASG